MKLSTILPFIGLAAAQTPAPYTDANSGITFNTYINPTNGYFFGLALPLNTTGNTDFIATIGGKGTTWSGVSLGGGMLNKLLILAWPNSQAVLSSFRKATQYGSPAVATGTFTQTLISNGTYVNSTHWTYTFLCSKCIQSDKTTFAATDLSASFGWVLDTASPVTKSDAASAVSKHSAQGQVVFDLSKAKSEKFTTWKAYATPKVTTRFAA